MLANDDCWCAYRAVIELKVKQIKSNVHTHLIQKKNYKEYGVSVKSVSLNGQEQKLMDFKPMR